MVKLKLQDMKLAESHSILAKNQFCLYEYALMHSEVHRSGTEEEAHCEMCEEEGSPRPHLDEALLAANRAWEICTSSCGRDHLDVRRARDLLEQMTLKGAFLDERLHMCYGRAGART